MKNKLDSLRFKFKAMLMACAMLLMSFYAPAGNVAVIKAGTIVPLSLMQTVSSKNASSGQLINFNVTRDIKIGKDVVVKAGSIAHGQVSHVKRNGLLGTQGEVQVTIQSITAVDGTQIYLTGNNLNEEGSNKVVLAVVVTLCCILGFLIKGGNAEIPAGTLCNATVMSNTEINL